MPHAIGGSTRGTTVVWGDYGLRVHENVRMTARQLDAVRNIIRRVLKPVKGAKIYMKVFPDLPVTSKGAETRMGKGKGNVEFWACRVRAGRIIFEIGAPSGAGKSGGGIELTDDLARTAITSAMYALPVKGSFVRKKDQPAMNVAIGSSSAAAAVGVEDEGLRVEVEGIDSAKTSVQPTSTSSTTPANYYATRLPSFVRKFKLAVPREVRRKLGIPKDLSDEDVRRKYTGAVEPRKISHIGQL